MDLLRLVMEMAIVGMATAVVSLSLTVLGGKDPRKLPHLRSMISGVFWTIAIAHFLLEATGATRWYVKNYKPLL